MSTIDYRRGLDRLRAQAAGTGWQADFLVLEQRLSDNLTREQRYGSSEGLRYERAEIIDSLNQLTLRHAGVDFNSLCLPTPPSARPEPAAPAAPPPAPATVMASAGALRIAFRRGPMDLSLAIQNISAQELTEIHIILQPPPHVFLSDHSANIARLRPDQTAEIGEIMLYADSGFELPFKTSYYASSRNATRWDGVARIP